MSADNHIPAVQAVDWLEARLRKAASRHSVVEVTAFGLTVAAGVILALGLYALTDYLMQFPRLIRVLLSLGLLGTAAGLAWRHAARRTFRFSSPEQVARFVENLQAERGSSQHSVIISALEFGQRPAIPGSPALKNTVIESARTRATDPASVSTYSTRHVRVALTTSALAVVLLGLGIAFARPVLQVFLLRALGTGARYPTATRVVGLTWDRIAPSRQDYPIRIQAEGRLPANGTVTVRFDGRRPFSLALAPLTNGTYEATIQGPDKPFAFSFVLGDYVSDRYPVDVRVPAFVQESRVEVIPPAYTHQARQSGPLGNVAVPEGSAVTLTLRPDRPISRCEFLAGSNRLDFAQGTNGAYVLKLLAQNSARFQIHLMGADGLANRDPTEYELAVVRDLPPRIKVLSPAPNSYVCDLSLLQIALRIEDDYGLTDASAAYQVIRKVNGDERTVRQGTLPLDLSGQAREQDVRLTKAVREFGAEPGDRIVLKMTAADNHAGTAGRGESDQISVDMVSAEELRKVLEGERGRTGALILKLRDDEKKQADAIDRRLKGGNT